MAERRDESIAPPRTLSGAGGAGDNDVVLPPPPDNPPSLGRSWLRKDKKSQDTTVTEKAPAAPPVGEPQGRVVRKARLRLVQVEPWSVMKTAFLLSVAIGIVTVVAVAIVWGVLGAAGLWDSVNSIVRDTIQTNSTDFDVRDYVGTSRVLGFTMIVAVADIILITAIATLGAFLYNLSATLLGGVEVTFAEDR